MKPTLQIAFQVDKMLKVDIRDELERLAHFIEHGAMGGAIKFQGEIIGSWSISGSTVPVTDKD